MIKVTPDPPLQAIQDTLARAEHLARCTTACAYEAADQRKGSERDLSFSVVHLAELTQKEVADALHSLEAYYLMRD